jgi:hypothetical protein
VSEGVSDTLYTRTNISDAQYKEIERERERSRRKDRKKAECMYV